MRRLVAACPDNPRIFQATKQATILVKGPLRPGEGKPVNRRPDQFDPKNLSSDEEFSRPHSPVQTRRALAGGF